ncbi:hypothetical protein RIF29_18051 [Crotalaria pallida]|uniref:Bifunctional inhibitor/plant lipid transfer protein/seed storage helical domain-containing protein n=1 Tax=Crotalaria pallida TaxID=3830 RepID=A0AAN9FS09_CROPI
MLPSPKHKKDHFQLFSFSGIIVKQTTTRVRNKMSNRVLDVMNTELSDGGKLSDKYLVIESMAHTSCNTLVQWLVAVFLIALLGGAQAVVICDIDSNKLNVCRAAVTGRYPPPPDETCCAVIRKANLPCLCSYKSVLPAFGINPTNAMALPGKCGLKTPPECRVK